jgi:glucuronate isomerase
VTNDDVHDKDDDVMAHSMKESVRQGSILGHDDDRVLPAIPGLREIARALYDQVRHLPIVSPHSHIDPRLFAENQSLPSPVELIITPDHYLLRMLYSKGLAPELFGRFKLGQEPSSFDSRSAWRLFAENYYLFRGTPSRYWLDSVFQGIFDIHLPLGPDTADAYYDTICAACLRAEFRPHALFERMGIEVLATTDSPLDVLSQHQRIEASDWPGRVIPTYRPDSVTNPELPLFHDNLKKLANITGEDTTDWDGFLAAHRNRREYFIARGATATDHGHPSPATANLAKSECERLFARIIANDFSADDAELFRAQVLTEMAAMSVDDGLVMQMHCGASRNYNRRLYEDYGPDIGADMPVAAEFVDNLRPLLDRFGNRRELTLVLFTLDESTYTRELAPLAGHFPSVRLGAPWWFHDSPEGMMHFRRRVTETAGFYNAVGFTDDSRVFLSLPARHDLARRVDCSYLAELVVKHRIDEDEALELAIDLSYRLAKSSYRLNKPSDG